MLSLKFGSRVSQIFVILCAVNLISFISSREYGRLDELEDEILKELYGSTVQSTWININVGNELWETHFLSSKHNESKDTILLIHGYGSASCLAWRGVIPRISNIYNIIAVDLPGFGRSPGPHNLLEVTTDKETIALYCEFFSSIFDIFSLNKPYIVGHSFGGLLISHCISLWPHKIGRLLLADIPGIYSMNGGWDYFWSTFYYLGLPHTFFRQIGSHIGYVLIDLILSALDIEIDEKYVHYWYQLQISPAMQCERIAHRFVRHYLFYSRGTSLILLPLLRIMGSGVPVSLAYGSHDTITPMHQGVFLANITGGFPVYEVRGAGHVPYNANGGADFTEIILSAQQTPPLNSSSLLSLRSLYCCLSLSQPVWESYYCSPVPAFSNWLLHQLYGKLHHIAQSCKISPKNHAQLSRSLLSTNLNTNKQEIIEEKKQFILETEREKHEVEREKNEVEREKKEEQVDYFLFESCENLDIQSQEIK
mmetsp:Transcript_30163/g.30652  ORF Transcript_30163/g.30652 Transcript_30163/m.30652 type:complete len:480 (-) Transcript_30163:72-1511(-)